VITRIRIGVEGLAAESANVVVNIRNKVEMSAFIADIL
jgi:hypothetical protein